jgi:hypothetical protein
VCCLQEVVDDVLRRGHALMHSNAHDVVHRPNQPPLLGYHGGRQDIERRLAQRLVLSSGDLLGSVRFLDGPPTLHHGEHVLSSGASLTVRKPQDKRLMLCELSNILMAVSSCSSVKRQYAFRHLFKTPASIMALKSW